MHKLFTSVAALLLLTGCQAVLPQPTSGAAPTARIQGLGLTLQRTFTPARLPKYVTLGNPTKATLNWTPVSPQVYIAGRLLPSTRVGSVVSFTVPGGSQGGWGGPQTLEIRDGANTVGRTTYVLGRSYLADQPGGLLFLLAPGRTQADLQRILDKYKVGITSFTPLASSSACQGSLAEASFGGSAAEFEALLEQLDLYAAQNPGVILGVNPRTISSTGASPTQPDPSLAPMKAAEVIGAPKAAARGLNGKGSLIAVLDTGIGMPGVGVGLKPFGSRLLLGQQFTRESQLNLNLAKVTDDDFRAAGASVGHGTQVASLAAGVPYGVAPEASVLPLKVCDAAGQCRVGDIVRGLCWALSTAQGQNQLGSLIVNMSLGGDTGDFERDVLRTVLSQTAKYGVQLVASAGNDWTEYLSGALYEVRQYPAALNLSNLTAVGAAEQPVADPAHLRTSRYSVRGSWVDVLAPGTLVWANGPDGKESSSNQGTSFAAPQVAGALALWRQRYPADTAPALQERLRQAASVTRVLKPDPQAEADPYQLTRLLDVGSAP